jgi:signal recognition particle subunit SRP54
MGTETPVLEIVRKGLDAAKSQGCDLVIVDTAGRLHIDEVKMDELVTLKQWLKPDYTFLVADAMTGQDAVHSASAFHEGVGIDGVCLTKIDGDARGGAALSIRAVAEKPIFFIGTGEKADDLEQFHPDRIASRILGMGDIVSLVERAQEQIDQDEALEMQRKLKRQEFSLQDFLDNMRRVKKMGPLSGLMKLIPGMSQLIGDAPVDDDSFKPMESMILSMTPDERDHPDVIDGSRRKRIAKGSGQSVQEVKSMLREFEAMRKMMGQMMSGGMKGMGKAMKGGGEGGPPEMKSSAVRPGRGDDPLGLKVKPKHRRKRDTKANRKKKRKGR